MLTVRGVYPVMVFWAGVCLLAADLPGAQWGDLKGQFICDGQGPAPAPLTITKDGEFCCQHDLVDESLLVDVKTRGLKNVVVFLCPASSQSVAVHADYQERATARVKLDNLACRFEPRVVLLWKSQTLLVGNSDPVGHSAMLDLQRNPPVNVTIPSGGESPQRFSHQERQPVSVSCSIHPWMRGWLLVRDTPYMAVTDQDGRFEIKGLPVGQWEFAFWHERAQFLTEVVQEGRKVSWKRGRTRLAIQPGSNELGVVTVPLDTLTK